MKEDIQRTLFLGSYLESIGTCLKEKSDIKAIEWLFNEHGSQLSYAFLESFNEEELTEQIKILKSTSDFLATLKNLTKEKAVSLANNVKGNIHQRLSKLDNALKDTEEKTLSRAVAKLVVTNLVKKYQTLRSDLGGSNKATVAALIGALVPFSLPIVGTILTIAYFRAVKAIARRIMDSKNITTSDIESIVDEIL